MKSRSYSSSWMSRIGLCLAAVLLLVAGLAPGGVRGVSQEPGIEKAPLAPFIAVPHPPGTGFVPPPVDLSHLTGQALPQGVRPQVLPDAFDWRDTGKVTPVKDQGACGSCYAFGSLGSLESKLLIDGAGTWDLSENHAKECNWKELNNFQYPPGTPWGSCDGGNSFMIANLYSQAGSVLESCDPYVASDVTCNTSCAHQQSVLDFRIISGGAIPNTEVLKQYLYDNGPIITSMYADSGQGFNNTYTGAYTFNYSAPAGATNHAVLLVGWSNNLPPVPGGSTPASGWIVKNSWGSGWGASGYFYVTYGAANIGYNSTYFHEWQTYDSDGDIWFYDEDGMNNGLGQTGGTNTTAWGLAKYTPASNTNVTRVEFWTDDATTDVDVYLYDDFDGTSTTNLLASKLNNAFAEAGYHSVVLDSPVPVTAGNDLVAVVKFTNSSYGYPLAIDENGPSETARTYVSLTGASGSWTDLSFWPADATIRLRTGAGIPHGEYSVYLPLTLRNYGTVAPVPPTAPTLSPIDNADGDGNYTVSWSAVSGATSYTLQEDDNSSFTSPTDIPGSGTSRAISGRAPGTYYYRANAANAYGPSPWSNIQSVVVASSPSGPNPGYWMGASGALEFYVTSDRAYVDDFAIIISVTGCGTYKITHLPPEPIVSNQFSFSGPFYGNGTFTSPTSCTGTTGLENFYISGCGFVSGGPFSYTATWQGAGDAPLDEGLGSVVIEEVDGGAITSFLTAEKDPQ